MIPADRSGRQRALEWPLATEPRITGLLEAVVVDFSSCIDRYNSTYRPLEVLNGVRFQHIATLGAGLMEVKRDGLPRVCLTC